MLYPFGLYHKVFQTNKGVGQSEIKILNESLNSGKTLPRALNFRHSSHPNESPKSL